ncbi:MAG: RNA polymerase sigma factor, partial [Actinobacteria bacterium]|nr:RNA polymerase sigma factor [Actinomycetota bacterium]
DLGPLQAEPRLAGYAYLAATSADVLRRLGRRAEAADEYERAMTLAASDVERRFLERRLAETLAAPER